MALEETALKSNLLNLFNAAKSSPMSEEEYAKSLAKIINDHIKKAQVNPGIPVAAPAGNSTSGPGTLS